jgi:hypothetical protein
MEKSEPRKASGRGENQGPITIQGDAPGELATRFDGVSTFSTTTAQQRLNLGETVTRWLIANPEREPVVATVLQSSDHAHHCLSIVLHWRWRTVQVD